MAEALYNKYRPQIFEDVVGQEHIERTLKNAIANDKISHAYMFTGPRGTGKTTTARLLAKALLCGDGPTPDPDGTCEDCMLVASGEHPDVYELDAASRTGVENVREEIIGKVNYAPTRGRYKVYIIDEVHMLSTAAFNALLKTLEEPPSHVVFVLCTTDPQKVPETIQSRCQRFDFRRIASEELISRLGAICEMEGIAFEGDALDLIAHRANGGMRDALTSLDQLIAFGDGSVTREVAERLLGSIDSSELGDIVNAIGKRDIAGAFRWTAEYMETGADLVQIVGDLTSHMRDMYVMSLAGADVALEVTETGRRELEAELPLFGSDRLARSLIVLGDLATDLKTSTNQRLSFEIALTRLMRPEGDLTLESLAERLETLERSGVVAGNGAVAATSSVTPVSKAASASTAPASVTPSGAETLNSVTTKTETNAADVNISTDEGVAQIAQVAEADESKAASASQTLSPTVDLSTRNLGQLWETVLAHLKKIKAAYGVIFINAKVELSGDDLIISYPADSDFAFKASQKADAREALEEAFRRSGIGGVTYQIVKSGEAGAAASTTAVETRVQSGTQASQPESAQMQSVESGAAQTQPVEAQKIGATQPEAIQSKAAESEVVQTRSQTQPQVAQQQSQQQSAQSQPYPEIAQQPPEDDADFADFITAAFGEVVIEEVNDDIN